MVAPVVEILVQTFNSKLSSGSPQKLHFFKNEIEMQNSFIKYQIKDELDHSFVCFNSKQSALVRWKNQAGPIQLCGSAAYALAWIATNHWKLGEFKISSMEYQLNSYLSANGTCLDIPAILPTFINKTEDGLLFLDQRSGIYLLEIQSEEYLVKENWLESYLIKHQLSDIHGFCVFTWDDQKKQGKLRYFTPWHGRNEDYVTGSIHQYLTPLIKNLYAQTKQAWEQLSKSGGELISTYNDNKVTLMGNCFTDYKQSIPKLLKEMEL